LLRLIIIILGFAFTSPLTPN